MKKHIPQLPSYNDRLAIRDALLTPQSGVTLREGLFKTVFDNNRAFLRTLDMGAMMYWFDQKTGTPTDAQPYRGHFEDNLKGSTLSMFLMGAGNVLRWVEDEELARRIDVLTQRLYSAAEPDGFLMPVREEDFAYREYPHYVRIWLSYALEAVGLSHDAHAYEVLRKWQDWFNACPDLPIIRYLELAFQGVVASTSVYMTPIGKKEDIDVTISAYEEGWRLAQFMRREKDAVHIRRQPGSEPHAHGSELEAFEGYLDLYRATGRNYYLHAVQGAWELYHDDWQHAGGGIVMCEGMPSNYPGCRWLNAKNHYNELCCTSFWLYLNLRLHRLFPDEERYMNEVEKSLFNVAIANQDGGSGIRYFAYLEGHKQESGQVHCCCGVGTRIFGSLPELLYSVAPDTIAVNLYAPSELEFGSLRLINEGNIPYSDEVRLTFAGSAERPVRLRLRIPAWTAEDVTVFRNGEAVLRARPGSYAVLEGCWKAGDVITYTLKQAFRLTPYRGAEEIAGKKRYAVERGPILYALCGEDALAFDDWDSEHYADWLTRRDGTLDYAVRGSDLTLRPYFALGEDVPFVVYAVMR